MNKTVFAGTHLDKTEYAAFKKDAQTQGRTVRGHLRFIARQHLLSIGFDAGKEEKKPVVRRKAS